MKKTLSKKLSLSRETLRVLDRSQLDSVGGGMFTALQSSSVVHRSIELEDACPYLSKLPELCF